MRTLVGTVAAFGLELVRVTMSPVDPVSPVNVTVPLTEISEPPITD